MSTFPAKILLATDGSDDAMLAARAAAGMARDTGAELHVVHVGNTPFYPPPPSSGPPPATETHEELRRQARGILDAQVRYIREVGGEIVEAHLRMGKPAEEILRVSEEITAGLIVLGNQGIGDRFSRMKRFVMGNVSEAVVRYARCSVMVVRRDLYDRPPG